jgi:outer membrane protein TolC
MNIVFCGTQNGISIGALVVSRLVMGANFIKNATATLMVAGMLAACSATGGPNDAFLAVSDVTSERLGTETVRIRTEEDSAEARARVEAMLKKTLSAEAAVQIALFSNRGLQAAYNEIGLAEANLLQESLPPNPSLSLTRLASSANLEIEGRIVANILAIATIPVRKEIAGDRLYQAQLRAIGETLRLAAETRRAYYRTVAAKQQLDYLGQARASAEAASDLAKKLGETGAWNKLDQAREHAFYAETSAQEATAQQRYRSEREKLVRLMGLWGRDLSFKLPSQLPPLPKAPRTLQTVEANAVAHRVDLEIARRELDVLAKMLGLTQATGFINVLEAGPAWKRDSGVPRERGVDVQLTIPMFDFGQAKVQRAQETYMQAVNRLAEKAINARSESREAYQAYRTTYDVARHYRDEVVPLRKTIADESQLRYSGMLVDVFRLLADTRQSIQSLNASIDAQRDFWLAAVDLSSAVIGSGTSTSEMASGPTISAASDSNGH